MKPWIFVCLAMFLFACGEQGYVDKDKEDDPEYNSLTSDTTDQDPQASLIRSYEVSSYHISNLRVVHPGSDAGSITTSDLNFYEHHYIEIYFGITSTGNPMEVNIFFGLMEKMTAENPTDADYAALTHCSLGSTIIEHGGGTTANEVNYSAKFLIPEECVEGLADGSSRTFNVWVSADTEGEVQEDSEEEEHGTVLVFSDLESSNDRNQLCLDADGNAGCVYDILVQPTHGLNLEISEFNSPSSVAILSTTTGDHSDAVDSNSNAQDEHNEPFLQVNTDVMVVGGEGLSDGATDPLADKTVTLSYAICPGADLQPDTDSALTESCAGGTSWSPLTIYSTVGSHENHASSVEVTDLVSGRPNSYSHFLYAEGDTRTKLATGGDWDDFAYFAVRACVVGTDLTEQSSSSGTDFNTTHSDNCKYTHVTVANPVSSDHSANTYSFNRNWSKTYGSTKTVGAKASFFTNNTLNLSGAVSKTSGTLSTTGWVSLDIAHAHAYAGAYVSLVGSYIDIQQKLIGITLFSYSKTIEEINYSKDWTLAKEACATFRYGVLVLSLNVAACASGSAGFEATLAITAKDGDNDTFDGATKIGDITVTFTPSANFGMEATAYVSIAVARGGVEGTLDLLTISLPVTSTLNWGLTSLAPQLTFRGTVNMNLDIDTLSGALAIFADTRSVKICSKKFKFWGKKRTIKYPCGFSWNRKLNYNLVSWKGNNYSFDLLSRYKTAVLQ